MNGQTVFSREGTTQGDPLSLVFYALATIPLIKACRVQGLSREVWYAADATRGGRLLLLRTWWDNLVAKGPRYGYFPNGMKTWLVVKSDLYETAADIFAGTGVQITTQGRRHLGAALGCRSFVESFVSDQVNKWVEELRTLSRIATCHP